MHHVVLVLVEYYPVWASQDARAPCRTGFSGQKVLFGAVGTAHAPCLAFQTDRRFGSRRMAMRAHSAVQVWANGRFSSGQSGLPTLRALQVWEDGTSGSGWHYPRTGPCMGSPDLQESDLPSVRTHKAWSASSTDHTPCHAGSGGRTALFWAVTTAGASCHVSSGRREVETAHTLSGSWQSQEDGRSSLG